MNAYRSPWAVLDIKQTNDDRAIRKAYSAKLKQIDVEADPAAFIALRDAMEQARRWAAYNVEQESAEGDVWGDENEGSGAGSSNAFGKNESGIRNEETPQRIEGIEIHLSPSPLRLFWGAVSLEAMPGRGGAGFVTAASLPPVADIPHYTGGGLIPPVQRRKAKKLEERAAQLPLHPRDILFPMATPLLADMLRWRTWALPDAEIIAEIPSAVPPTPPLYPPVAPSLDLDEATATAPPVGLDDLYPAIPDQEPAQSGPPPAALDKLYPAIPDIEPAQDNPPAPAPALDDLYPVGETPDYERWPDFQGAVSFRRDDWGNADRERLADLLGGASFGPAEAAEAERLAQLLLGSEHLDALDYRDWMENWMAILISETLPRSDSVLALASAKFSWGADPGQLHNSPALDACLSRNRDLEAVRKLADPKHKYHKLFNLLQQPGPEKLNYFGSSKWQEVQNFLDAIRSERPTAEWALDKDHVALWDQEINKILAGKYGGQGKQMGQSQTSHQPPTEAKFKWYHGLFIAFMVLQLLGRCATASDDWSGIDDAATSASRVIDYEDKAREADNVAEIKQRADLADRFNNAVREDDDKALAWVHDLSADVDVSRYFTVDDITAYLNDRCDNSCRTRMTDALKTLSETTVKIGTPVADGNADKLANTVRKTKGID